MNVYEKIYASWKFEALTPSFAMRGGVRSCGCSREVGAFDYEKCQSLAEHSLGMKALVEAILNEPSLIPEEIAALGDWTRQYVAMSKVASIHDAPEALLAGDICADGSRDDVKQDLAEREKFEEFLLFYPAHLQASILSCYIEFQEKSSARGWFLYCADKTDAILTMLEYASMGKAGSVLCRLSPTTQDHLNSEICRSDVPYEAWMVQFCDDITRYAKYKDISQIFVNIILAARANLARRIGDEDGEEAYNVGKFYIEPEITWIDRFNEAKKVTFPCSVILNP